MDLERMAVRLRPRNSFEALDLGVALVRANARAVYSAWFAIFVPAAVITFVVFHNNPFWAWFSLWWLKPAFDRVVLAVLAPALFGEPAPQRNFFSAPMRAFRKTALFPALTWRRFDLARSFHLAVHQLERLSGKPMRQRLRVLDRDSRGAAVWLTFVLFVLEFILTIAISLGIALLLPVQTPIDTLLEAWRRWQFVGPDAGGVAGSIIGGLAFSLVEPLYVACGFTLYLQRRTHLEGWDIELRFRQLAARLASVAAALALALAIVIAVPRQAIAQSNPQPAETDAKREIRAVLSDRVFGHPEPSRSLKYVGPEWKSQSSDKEKAWDWSWLGKLGEFAAMVTRAAAWIAAGAVVALALYYLAKYVRLRGLARRPNARPDFLFGLDVRPGSLPDDVGAVADALAHKGDMRAALSLLYRGALVRFLEEGLEFQQGDTEGDCVSRVEAFASPRRRLYFMRLVLAWQRQAYAHQAAEEKTVLALAREWRSHFDGGRTGGPQGAEPAPA